MEKGNTPSRARASKAPQATDTPPPAATEPAKLVVVGRVGTTEITVPQLSPRSQAAAAAVEQYKGYLNTIDTEDMKVFVNGVLVQVKQQLNGAKKELAKITDPLVNIRREALVAKQAAENAFAPLITHLETAERLLKGEILRWEQLAERKRLEEEAVVRRRAEEHQRRLETEARVKAEEAARANLLEQQRAQALEEQGKQAEAERVRLDAESKLEEAVEQVEQTLQDAEDTVAAAIVPTTSVKMKGTSVTGRWVSEVEDVKEIFAGIADGTTPLDAVQVKVNGKLIPVPTGSTINVKIEGIQINMPFFNDKARQQGADFKYRGMKARYEQDLRVTA